MKAPLSALLVLAQAAAAPDVEMRTVRAFAFNPGEPPAEIQLWRAGENPTDYGVHFWTQRAAELVSAEYQRRGNPLQIDVEHSAAMKPGEPAPTGGYARLDLRNGEPWLVFDWSAFAIDQIRTRQRLFLSPEYLVDKRTNEIVKLIRVSLVGDPGTHNAKMLASAAKRIAAGRDTMDPKLVAQALEALIAGDGEKAIGILKSMIAQAAGAESTEEPSMPGADSAMAGAPPPPPAAAVPPPPDKKDEKVAAAAAPPAAAPAAAPIASPVASVAAKRDPIAEIDNLKRDQLFRENQHRIQSDAVRAWAAKQPLAVLSDYVSALPSVPAGTPGARAVAATRGAGQGGNTSRLSPEEKRNLDERMGLRVSRPIVERKGNVLTFRPASREECAQHIAARAKGTAAPAANGGVK